MTSAELPDHERFPAVYVHATKEGNFATGGIWVTSETPPDADPNVVEVDFEKVASGLELTFAPFMRGGGIRITACHAASTGLAARLARRLETWVLAPTHDIAYTSIAPTDFFFHPDDVADGARWVLFDPSGEPRADIYPDEGENYLRFATRFGPPGAAAMVLGQEVVRFTGTAGQNLQGLAWTTWSPTLTSLTKGSGTEVARYVRIGSRVFCRYSLTFAADSSMGTTPTISLPVTAASTGYSAQEFPLGNATFLDAGTRLYNGVVLWNSTTTVNPRVSNSAATYDGLDGISATVPMTWTTNDKLLMEWSYEAA